MFTQGKSINTLLTEIKSKSGSLVPRPSHHSHFDFSYGAFSLGQFLVVYSTVSDTVGDTVSNQTGWWEGLGMTLKILYTAMSHANTHWPFMLVQCIVRNVNYMYVAKLLYNHDARDL